MKVPTLYILCGLPFSGKSTMLTKISQLTLIKPIAFDKFWVELEQNMTENDKTKLSYEYVTSLIDKEIVRMLGEGLSVVYDSLNDTVDQRERLRLLAGSVGAQSVIIYLNTPLQIIKKRREDNLKTQSRHDVDDANFNKSIDKFVPPQKTENYIGFSPAEDIVDWVLTNLA